MKLRVTCFFALTIFFVSKTMAQSVVALSTGISTDLANKPSFYMVPITFRWEPFKRSGFFLEAIGESDLTG